MEILPAITRMINGEFFFDIVSACDAVSFFMLKETFLCQVLITDPVVSFPKTTQETITKQNEIISFSYFLHFCQIE